MLEGTVEGDEAKVGRFRKSEQVGIGPILGGRARLARNRAKEFFNGGWFFQKDYARIIKPAVVHIPSLPLGVDVFPTHDCFRGDEPEEAELGDATEAETRSLLKRLKPLICSGVMEVAVVGQGQPNIHVREKE